MIEANFRNTYQKLCIAPLLKLRWMQKGHPHFFTCAACIFGISILPLLSFGLTVAAFVVLAISGFLDTVDGSLARHLKISSSKGAALDIVSDRIVEFAIILGLYFVDPSSRALPALLMLGSILICVTSFLIVGVFTDNASEKSFHYSPGLIERAEAFIAFAAMILFPSVFHFVSYAFSFLVFLTALMRMVQFLTRDLSPETIEPKMPTKNVRGMP